MKKANKVFLLCVVLLIIVIVYFAAWGSKKNNVEINDGNNVTSKDRTDEDNNKNTEESTSKGEPSGNTENGSNPEKNLDIKILEKNKVRIFTEKALFGATVTIKINDKNIGTKSIFYQIFSGDEPITKEAEISKSTTMYPVSKIGSEVQVKFFDKDKKLLFTEKAVVEEK